MKALCVFVLAALGVGMTGCTPDFGEEGEAPVILRIISILAQEGEEENEGAFLNSDVSPIFNDNAVLELEVIPKNPSLAGIELRLQDVFVERYEVRYIRSDGRDQEGVDVPFRISGGLGVLVPVNSTAEAALVLVRHQAKFEPPLSNLRGIGGAIVLSVTAEITLHGRTTAGKVVSTRGFVRINFADFADEE